MTTGELIRNARKKANITQAELAKRLSVTPQNISQYERDLKSPKPETISKIAAALGKPFMEVFQVYVEEKDTQIMNRLNAIKADIEFEMLDHREKAEIATQKKISEFVRSANGRTIVSCYMELNDTGKEEAVKRVIELAEIPRYQKKDEPGQE